MRVPKIFGKMWRGTTQTPMERIRYHPTQCQSMVNNEQLWSERAIVVNDEKEMKIDQ